MAAGRIDRAALDNLLETTGNDPAFLGELIDTYLMDSMVLLAQMSRSIVGADPQQLRRAAHSLKSNSASFGALELSGMCLELEQQARENSLDGAAERVEAIEAAFDQVQRELRDLRPTN
jgi:HPt (histidine-containing phosphotransfer) domain-containing protein